jgi:hypothetical protein
VLPTHLSTQDHRDRRHHLVASELLMSSPTAMASHERITCHVRPRRVTIRARHIIDNEHRDERPRKQWDDACSSEEVLCEEPGIHMTGRIATGRFARMRTGVDTMALEPEERQRWYFRYSYMNPQTDNISTGRVPQVFPPSVQNIRRPCAVTVCILLTIWGISFSSPYALRDP